MIKIVKNEKIEETEKVEVTEKIELSKEDKIKKLKSEIREVRQEGRFMSFYSKLREGTVSINKNPDFDEIKKKQELNLLLSEVSEELQKHLN